MTVMSSGSVIKLLVSCMEKKREEKKQEIDSKIFSGFAGHDAVAAA